MTMMIALFIPVTTLMTVMTSFMITLELAFFVWKSIIELEILTFRSHLISECLYVASS